MAKKPVSKPRSAAQPTRGSVPRRSRKRLYLGGGVLLLLAASVAIVFATQVSRTATPDADTREQPAAASKIADEQTAEPLAESTAPAEDAASTAEETVMPASQMTRETASDPRAPAELPRSDSTQPAPTSAPAESAAPAQTVYAVRMRANARACAATTCDIVRVLPPGTTVTILSAEDGEAVSGSTTWYHIEVEGQAMYIHASLLYNTGATEGSRP